MSKDVIRRLRELERDNAALRQRASLIPTILRATGGAAPTIKTITVVGGNTLSTGQAGIKYATSAAVSVPSAYDPTVTSSFADGIGRGPLSIDGVVQAGGNVLIANAGTGGVDFALVVGDVIVVGAPILIPVAGDPNGATVSAYPPLFM